MSASDRMFYMIAAIMAVFLVVFAYTIFMPDNTMADVEEESSIVESATAEKGLLTITTANGDILEFETYDGGSLLSSPKPYRADPPAKGSTVTYKIHPENDLSYNELISVSTE